MRSRQSVVRGVGLVAGLTAVVLLWAVPGAAAQLSFCPPGSGAGQCDRPEGVAFDSELQRLYVADRDNNRVNVFEFDAVGEEMDFLFAFGWGVDTGAPEAQTCTAASGCQAGAAGSGPGQFDGPRSIAVDDTGGAAQGAIYVGTDNFRVQRFDPSGAFVLAFGLDVNKTKVGESASEQERSICTAASGDTCGVGVRPATVGEWEAAEGSFGRSNDKIAVGPGGAVQVGDKYSLPPAEDPARLQKFETGGALIAAIFPIIIDGEPAKRRISALAVDSAGDIYLTFDGGSVGIQKLDEAGSAHGAPYPLDPGLGTFSVTVDEVDNLVAGQGQPRGKLGAGFTPAVTTYDSAGNRVRRYGYGQIDNLLTGLAPFATAVGDVFGSESSGQVKYVKEPPPGPIPPPGSLGASGIASTEATLEAEVNPEGKDTEYHFEYVTEDAFDESGFATAEQTPVETLEPEPEESFELFHLSAAIGCPDPVNEAGEPGNDCLAPETRYVFQVVAENEDGEGTSPVVGPAFETTESLEILALWSYQVGTDAARLGAEANPRGVPATGYFEYVTESAYLKDKGEGGDGFAAATRSPAAGEEPLDFGAGSGPATATTAIFPLAPATAYRYRLVADNNLIEPVSDPLALTTFPALAPRGQGCANASDRIGPAAFLADCRAYELVSPLDKNNADVIPPPEGTTGLPATLEQSSVSGNRMAYGTFRSFGDAASAPYTSQYVATRKPGEEWVSHGISPPQANPVLPVALRRDTEVKALSPDLCRAWVRTVDDTPLVPGAIAGSTNIYSRQDEECGGESYVPFTRIAPEDGNLGGALELQGRSADGQTAVYLANDSLAGTGAPAGVAPRAYIADDAATTRDACVLPGGVPSPGPCSAGTLNSGPGQNRSASLQGALSADGTRLYWSDSASGPGAIYLRANPLAEGPECAGAGSPCTVAVSAEGEATSETSFSQFWGAARDGSRAIFATGGDLYAFDAEAALAEEEATEPIAGEVLGVAGIDEDATRTYLASREAIAGSGENSEGDSAIAGEANLYLHGADEGAGSYVFVAGLAEADAIDTNITPSPVNRRPIRHTASTTPDGSHLAFMSIASPTGYDNTDAVSGEADAEIYLYDAEAEELLCASCNPSGGRPVGRNVGSESNPFWAAAKLPAAQNTLYASRALSEDGTRLYFESTDTLSARDVSAKQDVYQWEAPGKGDCSESDPAFSPQNGGCITLISSGKAERDVEFRDASPSGSDVFFATLSSLLPHDYGLVDIYDARVGGGLPVPPAPAPPCEGDACQGPSSAPDAPTPSSSVFQSPGNLPDPLRSCPPAARKAKRYSRLAKRSRRAARGAAKGKSPRKAKRMRRKATRHAKRAKRLSRGARRCRARNRKAAIR